MKKRHYPNLGKFVEYSLRRQRVKDEEDYQNALDSIFFMDGSMLDTMFIHTPDLSHVSPYTRERIKQYISTFLTNSFTWTLKAFAFNQCADGEAYVKTDTSVTFTGTADEVKPKIKMHIQGVYNTVNENHFTGLGWVQTTRNVDLDTPEATEQFIKYFEAHGCYDRTLNHVNSEIRRVKYAARNP